MKIMMLTSEIAPWAKTGGLGDVVASLSAELVREGHDVSVFLPHFGWITDCTESFLSVSFVHGFKNERYSVAEVNHSSGEKLKVMVLKNDEYFAREGIYSDSENNSYADNIVRFSSFTRAALETAAEMKIGPDVIHIHDWAPGLACLYLKYFYKKDYPDVRTVLTIHNIGYQGIFGMSEIHGTHLSADMIPDESTVNMLKIAVQTVDRITTVSANYADEIQTAEFGSGLEEILKTRRRDLRGILNGADYDHWNPEQDVLIPQKYSASAIAGKAANKKALQLKAGLVQDNKTPLFGMITRLAEQKGIEPLFRGGESAMRRILEKEKLQFAVLGTGEQWCEQELLKLSEEYSNFHGFIEFNNELSHLVEAACDFFLMPSRYEPCGLNQIYSLRYGTVPVVRKTGGLADTIRDESAGERANGIVFEEYSGDAIVAAVKKAACLFETNHERFLELQAAGMADRFTWEKSVHEYLEVYKAD